MKNTDYHFERPLLSTFYTQCRASLTDPVSHGFFLPLHAYLSVGGWTTGNLAPGKSQLC